MTGDQVARRRVEVAARNSRSRLLAFLAARTRDLATAEDALADAFHAALETWPQSGVPDKPEAWLLTVARHRLIDAARHAQVRSAATAELLMITDEATELTNLGTTFPDERLKLMFICAHPAIDAAARTPLMLQTVLGLDLARIASAFLVRPAAMGQRLSRVKRKIRDAGIAFEIPEARELLPRLDAVLETVYAAYGSGWDDVSGSDNLHKGLAAEAVDLGRLLLALLPAEPEVQGLLALMLHCEARQDARRTADGAYIPLTEQDVALWSWPQIEAAEKLLHAAQRSGRMGRFQLEAAIQSAHARRAAAGATDWECVGTLYDGLMKLAPTTGVRVARAAAISEARGAAAGWVALAAIPAETIHSYQPYWALAAHLLKCLRRAPEARAAYERALGLCTDPATREFLRRQAAEL